jgi:hypothetical protein
MDRRSRLVAVIMLVSLWLSAPGGLSWADEPQSGQDDQLSLADLAAYRAALSGKATADDARPSDPPARVGFRDLWERPDAYRGRRVTVHGRVARIFRQGPVGSFPPLLQVWIFSTAGDPFNLVFPRPADEAGSGPTIVASSSTEGDRGPEARPGPTAIPGPGRTVRFTGTFLKMVRYAAADGERLAPLIVGDRPPVPAPAEPDRPGNSPSKGGENLGAKGAEDPGAAGLDHRGGSPSNWWLCLMLAVVAAGLLARQHLRGAPLRTRSAMRERLRDATAADPPLHFVDHADDSLL